MKIGCHCGAVIVDQTDGLPCKAHFIPDVDWDGAFDEAFAAIEALADGRISKKEAKDRVQDAFWHPSRQMWQCKECGHIYVNDGREGRDLSHYVPATPGEDFEVLRRSSEIKAAIKLQKEKPNQRATDNDGAVPRHV